MQSRESKADILVNPTELFLLEQSVNKQKWLGVLVLLTSQTLQIPDSYWPILAKYKNEIITAINLKSEFLRDEYLSWSLRSATPLGKLAEWRTDFWKIGSNPALEKLKKELSARNHAPLLGEFKSVDHKNKSLIDKLCLLVTIDQSSRELSVQQDALRFKEEMNAWFAENKSNPNHPLFSIIEILVMLMDKGHAATSKKKNKYDGQLITTKVHLSSPKIGRNKHNGFYKSKHGVHIASFGEITLNKPVKFKFISTVLHELTHHLCVLLFQSIIPTPEWIKLADLIMNDISKHKEKRLIPENYLVFDFFHNSNYEGKKVAAEMPSRLVEFLIQNNTLPQDNSIFSKTTLAEINRLFGQFCVAIDHSKIKIAQAQSRESSPGKIELYELLKKGDVEKFAQSVNPKNHRRYNLFPLHLTALQSFQRLEEKGFQFTATNKFGKTPLEKALHTLQFDLVLHILDKMRKETISLPQGLPFNSIHDQKGQTVLIHAVNNDFPEEFISWLVKNCDVNLDKEDKYGKTAWDYAKDKGLDSALLSLVETSKQKEDALDIDHQNTQDLLSSYYS